MSLTTPPAVQKLQTALHGKAKHAQSNRFYSLYDKVCRKDVLAHAYRRCRANGGAAGVDAQTFAAIETEGLDDWLAALTQELVSRTYQPQAVRRVWIPKPDGKQRPLGIPTVRDRVVQMAVVLVLEPIIEADLPPEQYAYRPGRSAHDAVARVEELLRSGHAQVVDADLSGYFDSIPHAELMTCIARRVNDGTLLALIKGWLEVPLVETDAHGHPRRTTRHRDEGRWTPQGAPLSPLLSNLHMRRFVLGWQVLGHERRLDAHIVNYADDFVICCRGSAAEARTAMQALMTRLKLTVNEAKTHVCQLPGERFDFLGFTFGAYHSARTGRASLQYWPSSKRVVRLCATISEMTQRRWPGIAVSERVATLSETLIGWRGYFARGMFWKAFRTVDRHVWGRLRRWLCRKHKVRGTGGDTYPLDHLYGVMGVVRLERHPGRALRGRNREIFSESRMRINRLSGSMSGRWKRSMVCGLESRRRNPETRTYRDLNHRATSRLYLPGMMPPKVEVGWVARPASRPQRVYHSGLNLRRDEDGHHVIWADARELRRLHELHALPRTWANKQRLAQLKQPNPRHPARSERRTVSRLIPRLRASPSVDTRRAQARRNSHAVDDGPGPDRPPNVGPSPR